MSELRAKDVARGESGALRELRCPECDRLLIRFKQARGTSEVETYCQDCKIWAQWVLHDAARPMYREVRRKI